MTPVTTTNDLLQMILVKHEAPEWACFLFFLSQGCIGLIVRVVGLVLVLLRHCWVL